MIAIIMDDLLESAMEELVLARYFREQGLEGRARVCARRAVGKAIRAYNSSMDANPVEGNVLQLISTILERQEIPDTLREQAVHLITHVNSEHEHPDGVDLIQEAETLMLYLKSQIQG